MPTLTWNQETWNQTYDWRDEGEEWSAAWGDSITQWLTSLYPRLYSFLPAPSLLEIAPGHGRWTKFLLPQCENYVGIDMAEKCINACIGKFGEAGTRAFYVNDGLSLEKAFSDTGYDLIFSYDSLIHANIEAVSSYIRQILANQMLTNTGIAFLHHSNLKFLLQLNPYMPEEQRHFRDDTTSYIDIENAISASGGRVLTQELYQWGGTQALDCITVFCRADSPSYQLPKRVIVNNFDEASLGSGIYHIYTQTGAPHA